MVRSLVRRVRPVYANDVSAFIPEKWAAAGISILNESMLYAGLVYRDFENEVREFGQTVNTRIPGAFTAKRKQNDLDDVVDQDVTATNVAVTLNQRVYVSFVLGDTARTLPFQNLVNLYLAESMMAQARLLDQVVGGQVYQFLGNSVGGLGQMTKTNAHDYLLDARAKMDSNKAPDADRWMCMGSSSETTLQKTELFKNAAMIGDGGQALRNAWLGRLAGWNTLKELNTPSVRSATSDATAVANTVNGAVAIGATTVTLDAVTGLVAGQYIVLKGDYQPQRVTEINTNTLTLSRATIGVIPDGDALVQAIDTGLINQASAIAAGDYTIGVANGYPAGWVKGIAVDGTGVPKVGQLVSFKAAGGTVYSAEYCIVQVNGSEILLDRPLVNTLANDDVVCYGPVGDFNFGFQRNAIALVSRPLATPDEAGVRSAVAVNNGVAVRVTITYDGKAQGTRVTVDGLFGVATLSTARGVVLLG